MPKTELAPLYKRLDDKSELYTCMGTGNVCKKTTDHFREYRKYVQELAERRDTRGFFQGNTNNCLDCPVWNNVIKKITEYAKTQVR